MPLNSEHILLESGKNKKYIKSRERERDVAGHFAVPHTTASTKMTRAENKIKYQTYSDLYNL